MSEQKIVAWRMRITKCDYTTEVIVRVAKTEWGAKKMAMFRPKAQSVEILDTYTREQYHRVFGYRRIK